MGKRHYLTMLAAFAVVSLALFLMLLRRRFAVVTVEGGSMLPTFVTGDRVLVRRASVTELQRGQVAVFERPGLDSDVPPFRRRSLRDGNWLIKRVVAVAGDPRPAEHLPPAAGPTEQSVPPGNVVVLGDNYDRSFDSRKFGYLSGDHVLGFVVRPLTTNGRYPPDS